MIFRISILILHIPTMITRIPIIFFIPFPDSPSRLLQIAKNIAKSLSKKQKADVISCCQHQFSVNWPLQNSIVNEYEYDLASPYNISTDQQS